MPIEKIRPTFTFDEDRLAELKQVVPEAFADGRVNWEVLREALGDYLEDADEETERFGLFWPGKREARRLASMSSNGTLVPQAGLGVDEENTNNVFVEGENLEVLKVLQKSYANRVKTIYIDPPYNTGNDFVYRDDYSEPLESYLRRTGQADEEGHLLTTNTRASGRFHSNWLSMMYPRLRIARQLLREDGVIFVSIDDNEVHHLRAVMDEIFGEESFIAQIAVRSNPRGRQAESFVATVHEYVLVYARDPVECVCGGKPLSEEQISEFKYQDEEGRRYRLLGLRQRGSASLRKDRPHMFFPIYVDPLTAEVSTEESERFSEKVIPKKSTGEDGRWMWGKDTVEDNLDVLEARLITTRDEWDVFVRDYLAREGGQQRTRKFKTMWTDKALNYQNGTRELKELFETNQAVVSYPKPTSLLRRIVRMGGGESGDIHLDFFAGSCTTAHAVLALNREDGLNRRFIMIQRGEPTPQGSVGKAAGYDTVAAIGRERIRRVIATMQAEEKGQLDLHPEEDLGFKCYRLARSNYKPWRDVTAPDVRQIEMAFDRFETPLVEDWQHNDLFTEILLIEGFPLDSTVTRKELFRQNQVDLVTSDFHQHRLLICLDDSIASETIARLDLADTDVFVCLDAALSDEAKVRLSDTGNIHVI